MSNRTTRILSIIRSVLDRRSTDSMYSRAMDALASLAGLGDGDDITTAGEVIQRIDAGIAPSKALDESYRFDRRIQVFMDERRHAETRGRQGGLTQEQIDICHACIDTILTVYQCRRDALVAVGMEHDAANPDND